MHNDGGSEVLLDAEAFRAPRYGVPGEGASALAFLPSESESHRAVLALKHGGDVVLATLMLLVSLPLLLVAGCLILLEDGAPVLYRQRRMGTGLSEFEILKLRSMRVNKLPPDAPGEIGEDHPMVTRVGRFLRKYRIDELPQLVNVMRGEMSLVGPRPTLPSMAHAYGEFERRRLRMRPGMTGWAQVGGNVRLTWDERILLDVWYVDHWSLWLDARILARTLAVLLLGEQPDEQALREARRYAIGIGRSG